VITPSLSHHPIMVEVIPPYFTLADVILPDVILSAAGTQRGAVPTESKDPYSTINQFLRHPLTLMSS